MKRALALLLVAPAFAACGPPPETPALGCDAPTYTDLGYVRIDTPARFTTTGGRHLFRVGDSDAGGVFDGLSSDRRTLSLGDALTLPERTGPDGAEIANALTDVVVDPEHPGTVDLEAGSYWLATYNVSVTMNTCSTTAITGVAPAVGTVATSTPSPTPSLPPPTCATPGTDCSQDSSARK